MSSWTERGMMMVVMGQDPTPAKIFKHYHVLLKWTCLGQAKNWAKKAEFVLLQIKTTIVLECCSWRDTAGSPRRWSCIFTEEWRLERWLSALTTQRRSELITEIQIKLEHSVQACVEFWESGPTKTHMKKDLWPLLKWQLLASPTHMYIAGCSDWKC